MRKKIQKLLTSSALTRALLRLAVSLFAPRNLVGAVGVVFDQEGRILIAEHVYRSRFRWGLPGGWIERGEDPAAALQREMREELALEVKVGDVLLCKTEATESRLFSPRSIGVAFLCTTEGEPVVSSSEILQTRWAEPDEACREVMPFQREAIAVAAKRRRDTRSDPA